MNFDRAIEQAIITKAIDDLLAAGYSLGVNDGEETVLKRCTDKATILKAMFSTDEDLLLVYWGSLGHPEGHEGKQKGWIRLIYGNGDSVISDYTTSLETELKGTNDFANAIEAGEVTVTITAKE